MSRRATQADVARLAGVSQATVSLVLNDVRSVRLSEQTRERVLEAIRLTGYAANPLAQGLAGGRSRMFGVVASLPTFAAANAATYQPYLEGIEADAESLGVDLLFFTSAPVDDARRRLFTQEWNRTALADGCVVFGPFDNSADMDRLADSGLPLVFIGRPESRKHRFPYVAPDYLRATETAVRRLINLGHRRIIFLGGTTDLESTTDQRAGYREAATKAGLRPLIYDCAGFETADLIEAVSLNSATAVVVGGNCSAEHVRRSIVQTGRTVPGDISVSVLGGLEFEESQPMWSGFRTPRREIGARAVAVLQAIVTGYEDPGGSEVLLPCPDVDGASIAGPSSRSSSIDD